MFFLRDYYYNLPDELIAQTPIKRRDESRLLSVDRKSGAAAHRRFSDITEYLTEGDVLVINETKVIPARLYGSKGGASAEFLLVKNKGGDIWEVMVKPGKRVKTGDIFIFQDDSLEAEVLEIKNDGNRIVKFTYDGDFDRIINTIGVMPLPPYIKEKLTDNDRYQTVYAKECGSVAAPTAGLHFTPELLEKIRAAGVKIAPVLLHVGTGTFKPVKTEKITDHKMHSEYYSISRQSADLINNAGRVIAVGTTSCRTLESSADSYGSIKAGEGDTDIFIYGDYKFKVTDALITNFHLPESTLLMLVSAFYEREKVLGLYKEAIEKKYRFFSFGDAMFIY